MLLLTIIYYKIFIITDDHHDGVDDDEVYDVNYVNDVGNDDDNDDDNDESMFFAGTTVKVHIVNLENETVAPPVNVRPLLNSTVKDLHILIHEVLINVIQMLLSILLCSGNTVVVEWSE